MRMDNFKLLLLVGVLFFGALISSSCSMLDPYTVGKIDNSCSQGCDLEAAIKYANNVKENYRKALGEQATFTNALGMLLIPTGAAALTMGIAGAHTEAILITGGTGTSLFGIGNWLKSKPRQAAYIAGYNAVNCAIEAVLPFTLNESDLEPFNRSMNAVDLKIKTVRTDIYKVEQAKHNLIRFIQDNNDPQIQSADASIRSANSVIASTIDARNKGFLVRIRRSRAGNDLVSAVDAIKGQVYASIQKSQLDLSALSTIIDGLGQVYSQFTTVPDHLMPTEGEQPSEMDQKQAPKEADLVRGEEIQKNLIEQNRLRSKLDTESRALKESVEELLFDKRRISDIVNLLTAEESLPVLEKCGVDPSTIITNFTINPTGDVVFTEGQVSRATRSIIGGKKPFGVMLSQPAPGLHITQPFVFGRAIVLTSDESLKAGTYTVQVVDGTERIAHFNILVNKGSEEVEKNSSIDTIFSKLSDDEKKAIQVALCAKPIDGIWGDITEEKLKVWEDEAGRTIDGILSDEEASELKDEGMDLLKQHGSEEVALNLSCETGG